MDRKREQEIFSVMEKTLQVADDARMQGIALEAFCDFLLAEVARSKPDPKGYMTRIVPTFLGFWERMSDVSTPSATETVERVLRFAEQELDGPTGYPSSAP